ncbi:uncharacterized protein VTP21DRAFT_32 [Calcarisporiella thermophila]|uniref:uncharacterized protein n=1 Tax=Calcarisporiella thermophila TaxID=911321 RepID=UPI00374288AE
MSSESRCNVFLCLFLFSCLLNPSLHALLSSSQASETAAPSKVFSRQHCLNFAKPGLETDFKQAHYCDPFGITAKSSMDLDYEKIEQINADLNWRLNDLVRTRFFKYYKVNLYRECPFWTGLGCTNRDCSVSTVDESHIPKVWRSEWLGKLRPSPAGNNFEPFKDCPCSNLDFCVVEDEADQEGAYVNLLENPERFTGYNGEPSVRVWRAIYEENCFNLVRPSGKHLASVLSQQSAKQQPFGAKQNIFAPAISKQTDFTALLMNMAEHTESEEEVCLEKKVYYRLISGMHSSISTHICKEYLNQTTGEWGPNLDCFMTKVGSYPERIQNVYFNYAVILRALTKLGNFLHQYKFCTGDDVEDSYVQKMVDEIVILMQRYPPLFDETQMFVGPSALLKEEFKLRFRNVSRIMDCIGCEKCQLWGKLQTVGIGTALKILFSFDQDGIDLSSNNNLLQRSEIVALFNTFNRVSESLQAIEKFKWMYQMHMQEIWKWDGKSKAPPVELKTKKAPKEAEPSRLPSSQESTFSFDLNEQKKNMNSPNFKQEMRVERESPLASPTPKLSLLDTSSLEVHALYEWMRSALLRTLSNCCRHVANEMRRWGLPVPAILEILASKSG